MDVGRTNLFQMDIQTAGPPIAGKPYPMDEEIRYLENAGCISQILGLWAAPVIIVPKIHTL